MTITSSTFGLQPDNYYTGGLIRITITGVPHARAILTHTGDDIEIDLGIPGLAVGNVLQTLPGCDRTINTCINKFNNVDNYGGFPYIPIKNPMGGAAPIF